MQLGAPRMKCVFNALILIVFNAKPTGGKEITKLANNVMINCEGMFVWSADLTQGLRVISIVGHATKIGSALSLDVHVATRRA